MKWILRIVTLQALFLLSFSSSASSADDFMITYCDTCSSSTDFSRAANVANSGKVLVFNLRHSKVKAFQLYYEPMLGGTQAVPISVPQEAFDAIDMYHNIIDYYIGYLNNTTSFDSTMKLADKSAFPLSTQSQIHGSMGLACGPSGNPQKASFIPDGIFGPACAAHDSCYDSGQPQALCDAIFREDLYGVIEDALYNSSSLLTRAIARKALREIADEYADFVEQSEEARDAYCSVSINSSKPSCTMEPWSHQDYNLNLTETFSGVVNTLFEYNVNYVCKVYIIETSLGSSQRYEICFLAPTGN